jgi:hypothetical protein
LEQDVGVVDENGFGVDGKYDVARREKKMDFVDEVVRDV